MGYLLSELGTALKDAFLMAWAVWWALVLGFLISAHRSGLGPAGADRTVVERQRRATGRAGDGPGRRVIVVLVCGDRDCKDAVSEGRFGGIGDGVPVRLDQPGLGAWSPATNATRRGAHGRCASGSRPCLPGRAWRTTFRGDWQMLWREITAGFLLAALIGLLRTNVFDTLFKTDAPSAVTAVENVIVGPIIAVMSFVCSVGNVPLAAVFDRVASVSAA
jgi:hypothetical protein